MTEKLIDQTFTISLVKSAQEFYLHVEELGILVHDKDIAIAYEKMEKEKKAVLERLAAGGVASLSSRSRKKRCGSWRAFFVTLLFLAFFLGGLHYMLDRSAGRVASAITGIEKSLTAMGEVLAKTNEPKKETDSQKIFGKTWPVSDGGNGHYYRLVLAKAGGITGISAKEKAKAMGGYLATLTSMAENDFAYALVAQEPSAFMRYGPYLLGSWIGAEKQNEKWNWITGEKLVFTNWQTNHPSADKKSTMVNIFYGNNWISNDPNHKLASYLVEFPPHGM